jgi:hypothetical protein
MADAAPICTAGVLGADRPLVAWFTGTDLFLLAEDLFSWPSTRLRDARNPKLFN